MGTCSSLRRRMMMGARGGSLPYDAEVEYLESTGTQYIDTGFLCDYYTDYEVGFYWGTQPWRYVFGTKENDSSKRFSLLVGTNRRLYFNNGNKTNEKTSYLTDNEVNNLIVVKKVGNDVYVNGTKKITFTPQEYEQTLPVCVFFCNSPSDYDYMAKLQDYYIGRISYIKIGTLDLISVRVGQVGYMYDKVSGQLFGNAGTGSFILGPDV